MTLVKQSLIAYEHIKHLYLYLLYYFFQKRKRLRFLFDEL